MVGQVPGPSTVLLCGFAGAAEVLYEILALLQFLLLETEDGADILQAQGQSVVGSPDHCAFP